MIRSTTAVRRGTMTAIAIALLLVAVACAAQGAMRTVTLEPLSDSGVTGSVVLTDVGQGLTQVVVQVDPAGNLDMPAHIHPGTCVDLVPQPQHPLHNVVNGASTTIVDASLADLMAGNLAVNLHRSIDDLGTYTACANLR